MEIKKILIADDEKQISSYLDRKLTKLGYDVLVADDGEEALETAFVNQPGMVLLDVKMPKMDGIETCKRLRADERTKDIRIIILSAKAQTAEINAGMDAGADKYLCKPIGFPDILKEIQAFEKESASRDKV